MPFPARIPVSLRTVLVPLLLALPTACAGPAPAPIQVRALAASPEAAASARAAALEKARERIAAAKAAGDDSARVAAPSFLGASADEEERLFAEALIQDGLVAMRPWEEGGMRRTLVVRWSFHPKVQAGLYKECPLPTPQELLSKDDPAAACRSTVYRHGRPAPDLGAVLHSVEGAPMVGTDLPPPPAPKRVRSGPRAKGAASGTLPFDKDFDDWMRNPDGASPVRLPDAPR